ncbi:MAG: AP2 domain-containing protein [Betaproteobacteria bacterium]|nr:AP2 domain-containing protein [Betaproteobacteria bacterium]
MTERIKTQGGQITHGKTGTVEYGAWKNMHSRCYNTADPSYPNYGGRGISMCARWLKFENFYADMGERPDNLTLERIDNEKGYEPSNCKWATRQEQSINQRMKKNNKSGFRGVFYRNPDGWGAQVNYKYKPYLLGFFDTPKEAAEARDRFIIDNNFPHILSIEDNHG